MQFLYSGGCNSLDVATGDVLELMAAASFFQLEGLLRYTEARCAEMIDIDNVVAMYIHAKVIYQRSIAIAVAVLTSLSPARSTTPKS